MRRGIAIAAVLTATLLSAPPASATFHLIKIQEVGQGGTGAVDYVVLQMYAPGQNQLTGKSIRTYNVAGAVQDTFTFPSIVAQAENPVHDGVADPSPAKYKWKVED